jgi:hypothetical protein
MSAGYLKGFAGLRNEVDEELLHVEGRLPSWLSGNLLRNGPALFDVAEWWGKAQTASSQRRCRVMSARPPLLGVSGHGYWT